jgi:HAE1 family hydrophobic/amphiphilic exporter-1
MRIWVRPDQLAKLDVTTDEIVQAVRAQNRVNPAGQVGGPPAPPGQEFAKSVITQGYLSTVEEFGNIIVRANSDGSTLLLKDVAEIQLGANTPAQLNFGFRELFRLGFKTCEHLRAYDRFFR